MSKKKTAIILTLVFVVLLMTTVVGWIVTDNYLQTMNTEQTVAYARHFEITNWFDEPIDATWAPYIQQGIRDYRETGRVIIASGMDSRAMSQAIEHSLKLIDGIFIASICVFFVGTVIFGVLTLLPYIKKKNNSVIKEKAVA